MDPIHPIVPGRSDLVPIAPVGLPRVTPEEREQRRRERDEARERTRRRAPEGEGSPAGTGDDDRPHVDLIA
jgi:hypothetical protein